MEKVLCENIFGSPDTGRGNRLSVQIKKWRARGKGRTGVGTTWRLVAHVAKKYVSSEEEQEDLISIGTIGLMKAVDVSAGYGK